MSKESASPLDALEDKHRKAAAERQAGIEAATKDVRAAETMLREAKEKVRRLQADHLNASFAYDTARAALL